MAAFEEVANTESADAGDGGSFPMRRTTENVRVENGH